MSKKTENNIDKIVKEAQQASKKTSEFRNRAEEAKDLAYEHLEKIKANVSLANSEITSIQEIKEQSTTTSKEIDGKNRSISEVYDGLYRKNK